MKLRILSDIHNEFGEFVIPSMPDDKDTVLIIAGDLDAGNRTVELIDYLNRCSESFKQIVYVPGNHEYYHGVMEDVLDDIIFGTSLRTNIHIIDNHMECIDDTYFIGSTLWSDFDRCNPVTMMSAKSNMSDYNVIRIRDVTKPFGTRRITPEDIYRIHTQSKQFLFGGIAYLKDKCDKIVVVSHHAPSYQSIAKMYRGNSLNGAYASSLDYDILNSEPDVWIHGHTHTSFDYNIGKTRVLCNPRGYDGVELNKDFDPNLIIEV